MADSGLDKKSTKCPDCSSAPQKDVLCSSKTRAPPVLVVEMSQTSSIGSAESLISLERRKEK
ncbi:STK33 isoform 8, partial [Pongo abelii]